MHPNESAPEDPRYFTPELVANPSIPPALMNRIAATRPNLFPALVHNPALYPDLRAWLARSPDPAVQQAIESPVSTGPMDRAPQGAAPASRPRRRRRTALIAAASALALVLAGGGWFAYSQLFQRGTVDPLEMPLDSAYICRTAVVVDEDQQVTAHTVIAVNVEELAPTVDYHEDVLRESFCTRDLESDVIADFEAYGEAYDQFDIQVDTISGTHCGVTVKMSAIPLTALMQDPLQLQTPIYSFFDGAAVEKISTTADGTLRMTLLSKYADNAPELSRADADVSFTLTYPGRITDARGADVTGRTAAWDLLSTPDGAYEATGSATSFPWSAVFVGTSLAAVLVSGMTIAIAVRRRERGARGSGSAARPTVPGLR